MKAEELLQKYNIQPGPRGVLEIANVTRDDLADFLAEMGCRKGAEIGVAHGKYSKILMDANSGLELHGVDPYAVYDGYKDYALKRTMATLKADAYVRLDQYPTYHFVEKFSVEASKDFEDGSLDFVYIDANHDYKHTKEDIEAWAPKVREGGIVCGHDYALLRHGQSKDWGVIHATNEYCNNNGKQLYIWGLQAKDGQKRDGSRSWMFIK